MARLNVLVGCQDRIAYLNVITCHAFRTNVGNAVLNKVAAAVVEAVLVAICEND